MRTRIPRSTHPCVHDREYRAITDLVRTSSRPSVIELAREHSLARIHAGALNGDVILEQTQSEPPPDC